MATQHHLITTNRNLILAASILIFTFGLLTCRNIYEDDLFMQIRAGDEILETHTVQRFDEWSFTVPGAKWVNYQWLSMVIFRIVFELAGIEALVILRSLLVMILFLIYAAMIMKKTSGIARLLSVAIVLPIAFVACLPRMQLRPELFGFILFSYLLFLWFPPMDPSKHLDEMKTKDRLWLTPLTLWLWANLHGGTAIIGLFICFCFYSAEFFCSLARGRLCLSLLACVSTFFLTPIGFEIIPTIFHHLTYDTSLVWNSEFDRLEAQHFNVTRFGWSYVFWLVMIFITTLGLFIQILKSPSKSGWTVLQINRWGLLFTSAVLGYFSVSRIRMTSYSVLFVTPLLFMIAEYWGKKFLRWFLAVAIMLYLYILPILVIQVWPHLGMGIDESAFPVRLVEFIKTHSIQRNLFTSFAVGNYQLWYLPEYPTFIDPRDIIFDSIKPIYRSAFQNPEGMAKLITHYNINAAILELPKSARHSDKTYFNALDLFFPPTEWALVGFTNRMGLLLKRIPEHFQVISNNEYKLLQPTFPPQALVKNFGSNVVGRVLADPRNYLDLKSELARCFKNEPFNIYCKVVTAGIWLREGKRMNAISLLEEINARSAEVSAIDRLYTLQQLESAYTELEKSNLRAQRARRSWKFLESEIWPE